MKLISPLVAGVVIGMAWLPVASAQQPSSSMPGTTQPGHQSDKTYQSNSMKSDSMKSGTMENLGGQADRSSPTVLGSGFSAHVTGNVTSVDKQAGRMTLAGPDGPITVRFPPGVLANVNQGDRVTVAVALVETNPMGRSERAPSRPRSFD
jgi:hypothetical protein